MVLWYAVAICKRKFFNFGIFMHFPFNLFTLIRQQKFIFTFCLPLLGYATDPQFQYLRCIIYLQDRAQILIFSAVLNCPYQRLCVHTIEKRGKMSLKLVRVKSRYPRYSSKNNYIMMVMKIKVDSKEECQTEQGSNVVKV